MVLRVLTDTNFFDIYLKEEINKDVLINALDSMSTLMVETKEGTTQFINTVNIVSLELINTPPIETRK